MRYQEDTKSRTALWTALWISWFNLHSCSGEHRSWLNLPRGRKCSKWSRLFPSSTARDPSQPPRATKRLVKMQRSHTLTRRWKRSSHANRIPTPNTLRCLRTPDKVHFLDIIAGGITVTRSVVSYRNKNTCLFVVMNKSDVRLIDYNSR